MYLLSSEKVWQKLQSDHSDKGGVYKLHCIDEENDSKFIPINRILGVDQEGVLYIGKADVIHNRIGDLWKSLSPNYKTLNHHAGIRYRSNQKLQGSFPFDRLCVTVLPSENPNDAELHEMRKYFAEFGEVPPLNAQDFTSPPSDSSIKQG